MIVIMKKEWMWRNKRNGHRNTHRTKINCLRIQKQVNQ